MKLYITKWALTKGILVAEQGHIEDDGCFLYISEAEAARLSLRTVQFIKNNEAYINPLNAVNRAIAMRRLKINRLKAIDFNKQVNMP